MYTKGHAVAGRYVLTEILGRGSFAEVWAAYDRITQKNIAVKICKAALIAEDEKEREKAIRRFCDEIALMKRARSPYVVEILDYGKEKEDIPPYAWYYYIVMERMYLTVADYVKQRREDGKSGLRLEDFFHYARHCLAGLADLHNKGILHRDIKPSNMFFSYDNVLTIGDLGIARLSERTRNTQTMFGTVGYAAAELFVHKDEASIQSDLFSLGIVFYEMLTHRHPCSDKGPFYLSKETIRRLVTADFYPLEQLRPDLPANLLRLIAQMIALQPQKRPDKAEKVMREIKSIARQLAQIHLQHGSECAAHAKIDKAIQLFTKAARLQPDSPEALNRLGLLHYSQGELAKALESFQQALQIGQDKAAYNNRGLCQYYLGNYDDAVRDFSSAIQIDPKFAEAYNNRGLAYHRKKEYYRALQNFNRTLGLRGKDASAYNNRGVTYNEQGEYARAIADFSRAIKITPQDPESYFNRGLAYRRQGDYQRAIDDFSKAIDLDNQDAQCYYQRGLIYRKQRQYKKALTDFKQARKLAPDNPKIEKQLRYCQRKVAARKKKKKPATD